MTRRHTQYILLAVAVAMALLYLFPIYWMYVSALKGPAETFVYPPTLVPKDPNWSIFSDVWQRTDMLGAFGNSLFIAIGTTILTGLLGTGCAYVLARHRSGWIDLALFLILTLQVLPPSLLVTPTFVGFHFAGLLDTPRLSVIIAKTAKEIPFFIIFVRAAFMTIPRDVEEAALIDGLSRFGALVRILLPLARNGILVCSIIVFLHAFGEFIYARSMIQNASLQPLSLGLYTFMGPNSTEWNAVMAYASLYATPVLAVFILLQRKIVTGLTSGAIK